ncbi:TIGR03943 family protein, partial [Saccharothrix sp. MB29]|nr:TIGR03943 family protein [Saccharothrix sp. MB29]
MRRETQNILLVLLGGALLKLAFSGTYLRYVKESLQPWLVVTGAVMVVLALVAIVRDIRAGQRQEQEEEHGHEPAHDGHEHGSSRSPWMLLLPVLAVFLISPPALGADVVNRSDRNTVQEGRASSGFAPLPSDEVVPLTIGEFVTRTAWDDSGSLDDRTVRLTGFVVRKRGEGIGLTTVYRTLQSLADAGEVDVLRTDTGEAIYRRCSAHHHHHLVCRGCGRTVEVEGPAVEKWADRVAAENGFVEVSHTVEIFGTCQE